MTLTYEINYKSRPDDNYFDQNLWKGYDDFAIVGSHDTIWQDNCKPVIVPDYLCNKRTFMYAI